MSTILIVEDDYAIANLYKTKLELSGFEVQVAENGLVALKICSTTKFNLILLDLRMPYMDGEAFLERFRKHPANQEIPVVVLTNISREEAPRTLWHYGISGYLVKAHSTPKDLEVIARRIIETS